jgi:hypothetical protein
VLEIARSREEEAIEEWSAVQPNRLRRLMVKRGLEIPDVAGDALRIEAHVGIADEQIIGPKGAARRVKGLRQCMPTAIGVGIRPEKGNQLVATDADVAGRGQHAEEGQDSSLSCRRSGGAPGIIDH